MQFTSTYCVHKCDRQVVCRSYNLPVKDRAGRAWEFVIKSWANGTEHRRVYVLEQVSEYIKVNRLREGDAIGICADENGVVTIEVACHPTPLCRQQLTPASSAVFRLAQSC